MKKQIMICDPSAVIREMLASIVKSYQIECLFSVDAQDALQKIQENQQNVCLVFAEVLLPKASGFDFLSCLRKIDPEMPFVFVTTESAKESVVQSLKAGASDYVVKPFSIQQIQQKIERFIHL